MNLFLFSNIYGLLFLFLFLFLIQSIVNSQGFKHLTRHANLMKVDQKVTLIGLFILASNFPHQINMLCVVKQDIIVHVKLQVEEDSHHRHVRLL